MYYIQAKGKGTHTMNTTTTNGTIHLSIVPAPDTPGWAIKCETSWTVDIFDTTYDTIQKAAEVIAELRRRQPERVA